MYKLRPLKYPALQAIISHFSPPLKRRIIAENYSISKVIHRLTIVFNRLMTMHEIIISLPIYDVKRIYIFLSDIFK